LTVSQKKFWFDLVAMRSVSSTKTQRFQPEQAAGGIAPHFSGQQGNRLEKPETRPDPFFRAPQTQDFLTHPE